MDRSKGSHMSNEYVIKKIKKSISACPSSLVFLTPPSDNFHNSTCDSDQFELPFGWLSAYWRS